jgi:hypothetical protein
MRKMMRVCLVLLAALLAWPAFFIWSASANPVLNSHPPLAQASPKTGDEVDLALVLAVDISFSMDLVEQELQREGYIAALTSRPVLDAIKNGMIGRIAVTYLEWAGVTTRHVAVDWRIIEDAASARAFVEELRAVPIRRARRTSVTSAIQFSMDRLAASPFRSLRQVIDISGDGPNNEGGSVVEARDKALREGVTINGLPILLNRGYASSYDINNLDDYFRDCVIGGRGAFLVPVTEREQFADAIKMKILREVADASGGQGGSLHPAQNSQSDCQIGERLWRENWERN